jgi:MFS family permease
MSETRGIERRALGSFLAVLIIVELFSGVIQVYFTPLYATLAEKFHVSVGTLSWALTGFALATAVTTPLFAKLGDVWGHRRVLRVEVGIVALGSVLVAVAPNFPVLVTGRVLQGMFAAYLPLMFGLVRSRYSHEDTRRSVSYLTSVLIFGILAGVLVVGLIVRYSGSPTWALWLPAIGTLIGFVGLVVVRGETVVVNPEVKVDWLGAALLAVGLVGVLLGLSQGPTWHWSSARVLTCLIGGAAVLLLWCYVELHTAQPLADLRFLFRPLFLPIYAVGFCIYFGATGGQVVNATFMAAPHEMLGYGLGLDAFHIALWLPFGLLFMFFGVLGTARLGKAIGFRTVMALGAVLATLGAVLIAAYHGNLAIFLTLYAISALGFGLIESSTRTLVVDHLREGEVSMGEGIYELAITVGGAVGAAVLGAALSAHASKVPGIATQRGYTVAWLLMAAFGLVAAIVAIGYLVAERRSGEPDVVTDEPVALAVTG